MSFSKKKSLFSFLFFASILIYSCQKDFSFEKGDDGVITTTSTSLEGRITDETGLPVYGATVRAGLATAQTDKNGNFKFANASFTTNETFVTVSKSGFFQGSRTFFPRENSNNFIRIQLLRKTVAARLEAATGGDAEIRGNGGSVHFEPNTFVTAGGALYSGTVLVATHYLDPTSPDISDQMPGDLRGTSAAGATVGLRSFGMIAVELTGAAGQKLQIKSGMHASLNVNIPASLSATAPATIPLWYFNDSTGLWKQEGSAVKTGDSYTGDVTHFTFWNCDDAYEYVKIKAHIINNAGLPVARVKVKITAPATGISAYDYTDNNGYVDGFVPKNQTLTLEVINACGQAAYTGNIGPFSSQTDIGNVVMSQNTTTISGTVVSCANTPVTDGYVQIGINGNIEFAGIINGAFSYTFINCGSSSTAQLLAVDNVTLQQGNNVAVNITSGTVNAGVLTACGTSANTFFNMTIDGTALSGNTPDYYRYAWKDTSYIDSSKCDYYYAAYDSSVTKYLFASLHLPLTQTFNAPSSFPLINAGYNGINGVSEDMELSPLMPGQQLNFTEYGGLGQFVAGNFSGQLRRENYANGTSIIDTVNVVLSFRVRHVTAPF